MPKELWQTEHESREEGAWDGVRRGEDGRVGGTEEGGMWGKGEVVGQELRNSGLREVEGLLCKMDWRR